MSASAPSQSWVFSSDDSGTSSYLGVDISDITTERLSALKLKEEKGVEVTMVDQDAPAGKAGIKEHDVILTMNGTSIESGAQLRRMIHEMPPGRVVSFGLSRDGAPLTVKVQLADKHSEFAMHGSHPERYSCEHSGDSYSGYRDAELRVGGDYAVGAQRTDGGEHYAAAG